jgi:hypothetical protein
MASFALAIMTSSGVLPSAMAGKPAPANGTWNDCNIITSATYDGPNAVYSINITENFAGTLNGSYVGTERDVVYPDGSATFHGSGVFTGTINGKTGTFVMTYAGIAPPGGPGYAYWVGGRGTGGLAGIHGFGTFQGSETGPAGICDDTFAGTYTGQLQFAP